MRYLHAIRLNMQLQEFHFLREYNLNALNVFYKVDDGDWCECEVDFLSFDFDVFVNISVFIFRWLFCVFTKWMLYECIFLHHQWNNT